MVLLRRPADTQPNLKAIDYQKMLSDDAGAIIPLSFVAPVSPKRKVQVIGDIDGDDGGVEPARKRLAIRDVDGDSGDGGDAVGDVDVASSSSSSSSTSRGSCDGDSASTKSGDAEVPRRIEGQRVKIESHGSDRGLRITCKWHGVSCRKFRSLARGMETLGPLAATCYLSACMQKGEHISNEEHVTKENNPTAVDMRAYAQQM